MTKYHVEFCTRGGSFAYAFVMANTPADAVSIINGSELVDPANASLTRARIA